MTQPISHPRLHMGCGEALRSDWLLSGIRSEFKTGTQAARTAKRTPAKTRRGQARG